MAQQNSYLPDFDDGRISFYLDNDVFIGSDRDYTNGARLAWISGERKSLKDISPIQRALHKFSGGDGTRGFFRDMWGFEDPSEVKYQYGSALTQLIFTPESVEDPPPPNQRPYAGWAGLGFSLHVSDESAINSIELNFGIVGPSALAEQTQDIVHRLQDIELFDGWDSQIPDEFTFNVHFNQKRRYVFLEHGDFMSLPFSLNGFSETGLSLGNYRVDASVGWHFQFGYNVPVDFSAPRLSPTANSVSWSANDVPPVFSAYLIAGVKGYAVMHNITIDGPIFRDFDTGTSSEPLQLEYFYGIGLGYKDVELSYIQTTRTKEYRRQENSQEFGSLAIRIRY